MRNQIKTSSERLRSRKRSRGQSRGENPPVVFDPDTVFADPVNYLAALGLEAELVETRAGILAPAA